MCALSDDSYQVNSVSWNHDGTKLTSGSFNETVKIWDETVKIWDPTGAYLSTLRALSCNPACKCKHDVFYQANPACPVKGHTRFVRSVCFSPDG